MRALTFAEYGAAASLEFSDIPVPQPADNQVLVRVVAAGLNPFDWHLYRGDPYLVRMGQGLRRPKEQHTVGADVSGEVIAVGASVTELAVGDRVAGSIGRGSLAEFALASPKSVVRIPQSVSFEAAAALPMAAITALQSLRDVAHLAPGQTVLVNGASGGVGHLAVQLARSLGASRVVGVCSTANLPMVSDLGADDVVDYSRDDVTRGTERFDVVLDMVGNHRFGDIRRILKPSGTLTIVGSVGGSKLLGPASYMLRTVVAGKFAKQRVAAALDVRIAAADLTELFGLVDAGTIRPVTQDVYPLDSAREALAVLERGHVAGKLVVTV